MEWSPPALTDHSAPQSPDLGVRHCWFGNPAATENQMEPTIIAIDLAKRVFPRKPKKTVRTVSSGVLPPTSW